ncbi:hypothetical protein EDD86DRAFT_204056, partial [Gorgonomyces haynaldii]
MAKLNRIRRLREYFYEIDEHGQLFLEETVPKNITSCFKDIKFLDFFYTRLKREQHPHLKEYTHLSPCGPERNWIKVQDTPIVFHTLQEDKLVYGGSLCVDFDPHLLFVRNGRFYFRIQDHLPSPVWYDGKHNLGLIKSSLVLSAFADSIDFSANQFMYKHRHYPLHFLNK